MACASVSSERAQSAQAHGSLAFAETVVRLFGPSGLVGCLVLSVSLWTGVSEAAGELGANGERITTSEYKVDLTQGVARGNARVRGMGGAYVAVGHGVAGNLINPAAPAIRGGWERRNVRYDLGFFVSFPAGIENQDWFNTGVSGTDVGTARPTSFNFLFLTLTNNLRFGPWGTGISLEFQNFGLRRTNIDQPGAPEEDFLARFVTSHFLLARNIGDFTIGAGPRVTQLSILEGSSLLDGSPVLGGFSVLSRNYVVSAQVGALWRPAKQQFRIGAALRSSGFASFQDVSDRAVTTEDGDTIIQGAAGGASGPNTLYLPRSAELPWDLVAGVSYQFGPRPYNFKWQNPAELLEPMEMAIERQEIQRAHQLRLAKQRAIEAGRDPEQATRGLRELHEAERRREQRYLERERERVRTELLERYQSLPRRYLLLSLQLGVFGTIDDAVGVESFVQRVVNRSGQQINFSGHLGAESEVWPHRLKLRAGAYIEPSRFSSDAAAARPHGTFGFDVRVLDWRVFGIWPKGTSWRISGYLDGAPRYLLSGLALGNWH